MHSPETQLQGACQTGALPGSVSVALTGSRGKNDALISMAAQVYRHHLVMKCLCHHLSTAVSISSPSNKKKNYKCINNKIDNCCYGTNITVAVQFLYAKSSKTFKGTYILAFK